MEDVRFIPEFNWEPLLKYIEKAQKKADKLDCGTITAEKTGKEEFRNHRVSVGVEDGREKFEIRKFKYIEVVVKGQTPMIQGWKLVGVIEHSGIGDVRYEVPGGPGFPQSYQKDHCDHCGTVRHRKWTYMIQHKETGRFMQVGKQCLKDFLKVLGSDPMHLIERASWFMKMYSDMMIFTDLETEEIVARREWDYIDLLDHVCGALMIIRHEGFVSKARARETDYYETPTSMTVSAWRWDNSPHAQELRGKFMATEEVVRTAERIIKDWSNKRTNGSDFENNCIMIARSGTMLQQHGSMVCAMVNSWLKDRIDEQEPETLDEHLPYNEKERVDMVVYVTFTKLLRTEGEGSYRRSTWLVAMKDEDGRKVTWFSSVGDLERGKWYQIRTTIKKKDLYRGEASTIITRVDVQGGPFDSKPEGSPTPKPKKVKVEDEPEVEWQD